MNLICWRLLINIICFGCCLCGKNIFDKPLIITPYLEVGKVKEAQDSARVRPDLNGVKSYSGFFTVNKECGSNLFFWFIPAQQNWETAPVILWLNGGPGSSSLFGMFLEVGPFNFLKQEGFVNNNYHWTKTNNVIFLDQPVGTGFSFSDKGCYAENLTIVAQDVYSTLTQFFTLFPNIRKNNFFLTGESFAGHFIPAIAYEIDRRNDESSMKLNLKGFVIGNPFIDLRCHHIGNLLFELGIIAKYVKDGVTQNEGFLINAINERNFTAASEYVSLIYSEILYYSALPSFYNVLYDENPPVEFDFLFQMYRIRKQIHVGSTKYNLFSDEVYERLTSSYYMPANKYIEDILNSNKYIVGFYSGHLDVVSPYTAVPCVLGQLEWPGAGEYRTATRNNWYVDDRLAGWFKVAGNLFEVVVRASGHYVPIDQGQAALDLITAVVSDTPGTKLLTKLKTE